MTLPFPNIDTIQIAPGLTVAHLTTLDELEAARLHLQSEIDTITRQIEILVEDRLAGRPINDTTRERRAADAKRWKQRAIQAISVKTERLKRRARENRDAAILAVVREHVSEADFVRFLMLAREREPSAFSEAA